MSGSTIWELNAATQILAGDRIPIQRTGPSTAALHATYELFGGLGHSDHTTDANITGVVGTLHYVQMNSGTPFTADRFYTLPASAQIGERCGVAILDGDATYSVLARTNDDVDKINGNDGNYNTNPYASLNRPGDMAIFRCVSATNPDWILEPSAPALPSNHIRGMLYSKADANTLTVATGEIMINGRLFRHSSTTNVDVDVTPTNSEIYMLWARNSSGVLAFEVTTDATAIGTWNDEVGYYIRGTDRDYRRIGYCMTMSSGNTIGDFEVIAYGNMAEYWFVDDDRFMILNAGTSTNITTLASIGSWEATMPGCSTQGIFQVIISGSDTTEAQRGIVLTNNNQAFTQTYFFSWASTGPNINSGDNQKFVSYYPLPGTGNSIYYANLNSTDRTYVTGVGSRFSR